MFEHLKKIALDLKNGKTKEYFLKRIDKLAEDLASKDVLLINITEMESIFDSDKVIIEPSEESIQKITLENK